MFTDHPGIVIDTETAIQIDQRSFGSLFHRGYIYYDRGKNGFVLAPLGKQAQMVFETTNVMKERPSNSFSHYIRSVKTLANFHSQTNRRPNQQ
jgi:hypothetical protein